MKTKFVFIFMMPILLVSNLAQTQDEALKEVTLQKYKLQNKIKNLILKSNEAQKSILFLDEEIKEMSSKIEDIKIENEKISSGIKKSFSAFSIDLIKYKTNDSSYKNILRLQTFKNWNHEFVKIMQLSNDLQNTNQSMADSKLELRKSIVSASALLLQVNKEVSELDVLQKYLRSDAEKIGPDSEFFNLVGRLKWPVPKSSLIASKGFYKIPGARVYDYNEGLSFSTTRGAPVYPIASGILEGEIYVPNLGQILIVKHTENVRSFYIGAITIPGVLINDHLSPDQQFGLVKSSILELKLRFDTESLDPSEWVKFRR